MGLEVKAFRVSMVLRADQSLESAFVRAKVGDLEGFEQMYIHYQPLFYKRLSKLVDEEETIEDLYQDAIMKAWRALPEKQSLLHFEKSLKRIATNLAIDHLRHKKCLIFEPLPENETDDPQEYKASKQVSTPGHEAFICEMDCLTYILGKMSQQYRICVILQEVWGYSQREIAEILGISESTVSANVSRGMTRIREAYKLMLKDQERREQ